MYQAQPCLLRGRSAKEYLKLLAGLYTQFCIDSSFEPESNIQGKRDQRAMLEALVITDLKSAFTSENGELEPAWLFPGNNL